MLKYKRQIGLWSLVFSLWLMYRFEKLRVFHDSMELVEEIYKLTKKIPKEEKFALIDQLKRSKTKVKRLIAKARGVVYR